MRPLSFTSAVKSLAFAALAIVVCAHTAAAQRSSPGRQWAAVGPAEDGIQPWLDTTSAVRVGPDRFRVRLMMLRPDTAALGRLRVDRSISRVVYDCAGRTMETLESRWMLGDSVVNSVGARAAHRWTPGRTALAEAVCQLARRVAKRETAPAGSG